MKLTPRPFRGVQDHDHILNFLGGRQCRGAWIPPVSYWTSGKSRIGIFLTMFEGKHDNHQLWCDENGRIHAYTYLSPDENTPIYYSPEVREWRIFIHPDYWGPERMTELIMDAEKRLEQRTSREAITTVAYASDEANTAVLQANDYVKQAALEVYMIRPLSKPIPAPTLPDGFLVRPFAGETEIESRAIVTNSAFGGFDDVSPWSINNVHNMIRFCQTDGALDFVTATANGQLVSSGIATVDQATKLGEFDPVATHRAFWRKGLAKALLLTGLHWMRGAGMETAVIRTGIDNMPAQKAYESIGFQTVDKLYRYAKTG